MNVDLLKYGIEDEQSDIRAHVTVQGRQVVVFQTETARQVCRDNQYQHVPATQPGVDGATTAMGYLVPITDLNPRYILTSNVFPWNTYYVESMTITELADAAVCVVRAAIIANKFPLWVCPRVTTDKELDISGTDITVQMKRTIQVKHDRLAFDRSLGGSGNVYIQTHESNPLKIYGTQTIR